MHQSKEELEQWHSKPDAWGYFTNQDDAVRKEKILAILKGPYKRALDIGCCEGFITEDLPAEEIHGIEVSDTAAARLHSRISRVEAPRGTYDLVVATGVLYKQYDNAQMIKWIQECATKHVLIAGITSWVVPHSFGKIVEQIEFPYRGTTQTVTLYDKTSA